MSVTAPPAPPARSDLPRLRRPGPTRLYHLAGQLAGRTDLWHPHVRFAHESRWSVRVAVTAEYEAWLLTWLPGQSTGLHDHGGSSGAFVVVKGVLTETTVSPDGSYEIVRDLAHPRVRTFGEAHVHDVANRGRIPAISLHVYAPALETMRRFVLDDQGQVQVVSLERAGSDW